VDYLKFRTDQAIREEKLRQRCVFAHVRKPIARRPPRRTPDNYYFGSTAAQHFDDAAAQIVLTGSAVAPARHQLELSDV
jgi:hypothetical protein